MNIANTNRHLINEVVKGSKADNAGIKKGDYLLSINDEEVTDIFDYRFLILQDKLSVLLERNGENYSVEIDNSDEEDLGLLFDNGLMDEYRRCKNNCIFCFIDQMPPNMRDTLYFKDDDSRLSFLQGNYVTLTNLSDKDVDRIIKYRMEPLNISFQTTNPELRCKMLNNRFAGDSLKIADKLFEAGITMNGQIVLCKGYNDGIELERSIEDLSKYIPVLESVSVVPVGLTKYRDGLTNLEPFSKEEASKVINVIEKYQKLFYDKYETHFIHASDEWYIKAGLPLPKEERYDGYLQLENGVGMLRLLMDEFEDAYTNYGPSFFQKLFMKKRNISLATGKLAFPVIKGFAEKMTKRFKKLSINVYCIENEFFGENITVSGLITGKDLINQLKGLDLGTNLLLPQNMLKADEPVFLDDVTVTDVENSLQVKVDIIKSSGYDLFSSFLKDGV